MTNSRDVAELFGKRHDHVLRDIDSILAAAPIAAPNFGECSYQAEGGGRSYRAFNMTKDGFVLLAMGFTGKEALRFKLAYIARFNEMEAELRTASRSNAKGASTGALQGSLSNPHPKPNPASDSPRVRMEGV